MNPAVNVTNLLLEEFEAFLSRFENDFLVIFPGSTQPEIELLWREVHALRSRSDQLTVEEVSILAGMIKKFAEDCSVRSKKLLWDIQ